MLEFELREFCMLGSNYSAIGLRPKSLECMCVSICVCVCKYLCVYVCVCVSNETALLLSAFRLLSGSGWNQVPCTLNVIAPLTLNS